MEKQNVITAEEKTSKRKALHCEVLFSCCIRINQKGSVSTRSSLR